MLEVKVKEFLYTPWKGPWGSRRLMLLEFLHKQHLKVAGCQPYTPAAFTLQEIRLVFISVKVIVHRKTIVRPEGLIH